MADMINHPPHYEGASVRIEPIDVCEDLGFCGGNAIKYACRYDKKGDAIKDLKKILWYIDRGIEHNKLPDVRQLEGRTRAYLDALCFGATNMLRCAAGANDFWITLRYYAQNELERLDRKAVKEFLDSREEVVEDLSPDARYMA